MIKKSNRLVGQRFGRLVVLQDTLKRKRNMVVWKCQCDCGNIIEIAGYNLSNGNSKSCGCLQREKIRKVGKSLFHDLTGKKYGKLTVLERTNEYCGNNIIWKCLCECGNTTMVAANNLVRGHTKSCGCFHSSFGQEAIKKILEQNQIPFKNEYVIKELNNKRFDFAILNSTNQVIRLIEFDGEQHFKEVPIFTNSLAENQKVDKLKNEWAKQHSIPLVRIPYWERDNITLEMIMGGKYLV